MRPVYPGNAIGRSVRNPMPTAWWLRPVITHARVGEQMLVTWKWL